MKALIISDARGRILFGGASCPGSTADITQARQAGIVDWLDHTTGVEILTDAGYQGLGRHTFSSGDACEKTLVQIAIAAALGAGLLSSPAVTSSSAAEAELNAPIAISPDLDVAGREVGGCGAGQWCR